MKERVVIYTLSCVSTPGVAIQGSEKKMMSKSLTLFSITIILSVLALPMMGNAVTLTFDGFEHGEIVNGSSGVDIKATNRGGGPDWAVIFDSTKTGTADPDLESNYTLGNLAGQNLGNLLIIQESYDLKQDGIVLTPDDEGSRPAGSLFFSFEVPVLSVGFDLVDVEGPEEWSKIPISDTNPVEYNFTSGFFASFTDVTGQKVIVGFEEFVTPGSDYYDETVTYGNHSANRIKPITAASLGLSDITEIEINFGGSGAIDNLYAEVPIPSSIFLLGLGFIAVTGVRRRVKKA